MSQCHSQAFDMPIINEKNKLMAHVFSHYCVHHQNWNYTLDFRCVIFALSLYMFETNMFDIYCQDMPTYSFTFQIFTLKSAMCVLRKALASGEPYVFVERSFLSNLNVALHVCWFVVQHYKR